MRIIIIVALTCLVVFGAQKDDLVSKTDLKKFNIDITESLYSGYLSANEDGSAQFHYFFVLSDPSKPVTLWLNGGPGCSSAQGLFEENGPINFLYKTSTIVSNPYSWTKLSNMLYLESPINVGFSYGVDKDQTDESTAKFNLAALVRFFKLFDQFQKSDFYISGESYAGIYIPTLANQIVDYNQKQDKQFNINLKGFMLGNGCTDMTECTDYGHQYPQHRYKYLFGQNIITKDTYLMTQANIGNCYGKPLTPECQAIVAQADLEEAGSLYFNPYNIYGDCPVEDLVTENGDVIKRSSLKAREYLFNPQLRDGHLPPCTDAIGFFSLLRNGDFLKVIHIVPQSPVWNICQGLNYKRGDQASYYLYPKLIQSNLRIWKYSGDIDSVVPITGTLYWINKLQNEQNLRTLVQWRPWYVAGDSDKTRQTAGNYWKLDGITFISVRGAGHMVPSEQRLFAYNMFEAFLQGKDLPAE